jgi:hypothetical protein
MVGKTKRRIKGGFLPGVMVLGVLFAPVTQAHAAEPQIVKGEPFEVEIPFPDVCPDFQMVATVRGRPHSITFVDNDGNTVRGFLGGQLFVTWTRLDTGFSRTFAISGPTFFDSSGTPVRGTGRWTTPLKGTGWVLANGNLTLDGFEDGFSVIEDYNGRATAICDLMS